MKTFLPLLLVALLAASAKPAEPADQLPPAPEGQTWNLVWHDEFDGDKLDETRWVFRPDGPRKGGWWNKKAVSLDGDGHLVIHTYLDGDKPTDGCVTTQGKFEHAFGYYVARVKFQRQPGHWSAFWINGTGIGKVGDGGRDGTEIDNLTRVSPPSKEEQWTLHEEEDGDQSGPLARCWFSQLGRRLQYG